MDKNSDIIIIGAGLTGLASAYHLINKGKKVIILEARGRVGGRIRTDGYAKNKPVEMGATWLGSQHKHLIELLRELKIETFVQELGDKAIFEPISTSPPDLATLPPNNQPSFRIRGGTESMISILVDKVGSDKIVKGDPVTSITLKNEHLEVETLNSSYIANKVISTLPPYLFVNRIKCFPALPDDLVSITSETHTWMGESIKIALSYPSPFWKEKHTSGTIMSNVGPIQEMYDHSNFEDSHYALMGFLNGNFYSVSKDQRLAMIMKQLTKYYGSVAETYTHYHETIWRDEQHTFYPYLSHILPHQNNGNPIYQKTFLDNRLVIAGSETSPVYPGYMEGAVYSAKCAVNFVSQ